MPTITPVHGDITAEVVDAVVSPAQSSLRVRGGVDLAIHRAAGPTVLQHCLRRFPDGLALGEAGWTTAGNLPARWLIHTVAPAYTGGHDAPSDRTAQEQADLAACYRNCLRVADELGARSVAFPLLGPGREGWPVAEAVAVAVDTILATPTDVADIRLVTPDLAAHLAVQQWLSLVIPVRILQAVHRLHQRGHHQVRVLPYMSPAGRFWRLEITTVDNLRRGEYFEVLDHERALYFTTGSQKSLGSAELAESTPTGVVADVILDALGSPSELPDDPEYVQWFDELLRVVRRRQALPVAFDDSAREFPGWEVGWGSEVFHPEPPAPPLT